MDLLAHNAGTAYSSSMRNSPTTRSERLNPQLVELYRRAEPAQKLAVVARINASLQAIKRAQLQMSNPGLSATEQQRQLRRWWFSSRD